MSLMPVEQALQLLLEHAASQPALGTEQVSLNAALGRILAKPIEATLDVPPWDNSAMDGYALHSTDIATALEHGLPISQRITAGTAPAPLQPGTCARIFTGAPLPEGADTVEMQENTQLNSNALMQLLQPLTPGANVRPRGQDISAGSRVLEAGTRLRAQDLGLLASIGIAELTVVRPLRVAVASTGDELREPGEPLGPGQIYNSNRYTLIGLLQALGLVIIDAGILPDDPEQTRARLRALADQADLIITSGGVSVGEADFLGQVLREQGQVNLWKLAIKPGKPFTLGSFDSTPVIGLPGNPAAVLVTFVLLVKPWLLQRQGVTDVAPLSLSLPAGFDWPRAGKRDEYLRARLEAGQVVPAGNQSSGVLSSASQASGLLLIPASQAPRRGEAVQFLPFSGLLG